MSELITFLLFFFNTDRLVPYDGANCLSGSNVIQYCPSVNLPGIGLAFQETTYTKIYVRNIEYS